MGFACGRVCSCLGVWGCRGVDQDGVRDDDGGARVVERLGSGPSVWWGVRLRLGGALVGEVSARGGGVGKGRTPHG